MSELPDKILARVRGLLTKAESTDYPDEAEALTAKAAELIARHGIDQAMLAAAGQVRDEIETRTIRLDAPYAVDKAILLHCVATPLRCRSVDIVGANHAKVVGFGTDLDRVELLYTSLLLQAGRQLMRLRGRPGESTTAYRKSWLSGFSSAVRSRLTEAERRAVTETARPTPETAVATSAALVLANRSDQVAAAYSEAFPRAQKTSRRLSGSGRGDGHRAGQRADLGTGRVGGRKIALGS